MNKNKLTSVSILLLTLAVLSPWLHYGRRALICDSFIIKGPSMEPTLQQGEQVWVNKLVIGPRIYTNFNFETDKLNCLRLPGFRKLKVGDIALFNYPRGWTAEKIGFKINYVYAKRCIGIPGDSINICNSKYYNSRVEKLGIPEFNEAMLLDTPDSILFRDGVLCTGQFADMSNEWTIKSMGPILIPKKDMSILISKENLKLYKDVVEYETGESISIWEGREYMFKENYFFFAGDNVLNSNDSRYFGFVPESFVIGVIQYRHTR